MDSSNQQQEHQLDQATQDETKVESNLFPYIVHATRPSCVPFAVTGYFIENPLRENHLVVSRGSNLLQVFKFNMAEKEESFENKANQDVDDDNDDEPSLDLVMEIPIYATILSMVALRPPAQNSSVAVLSEDMDIDKQSQTCDLLLIITESLDVCIISISQKKPETLLSQSFKELVGRPYSRPIVAIDNSNGMVSFQLYPGYFKFLNVSPYFSSNSDSMNSSISQVKKSDSFTGRIDELDILDVAFVSRAGNTSSNSNKSVLLILIKDVKGARHIRSYEVDPKAKSLKSTKSYSLPNLSDTTTDRIIVIPDSVGGGILTVGKASICFYSAKDMESNSSIPSTPPLRVACGDIRAVASIMESDTRWLLSDEFGGLHILTLRRKTSSPVLSLGYLGPTNLASNINYIESGYVFIGSIYGDSQLVRLPTASKASSAQDDAKNESEDENLLKVVSVIPNHGPILDFCIVDHFNQGRNQLVACSGGFQDGSIRIMSNGVGFESQAEVELQGIKSLWSLRADSNSQFDSYLIQSFSDSTRILCISEESASSVGELKEIDSDDKGFKVSERTLFVSNINANVVLQVTPTEVRLVKIGESLEEFECIQVWRPNEISNEQRNITVATAYGSNILITLSGGMIYSFCVDEIDAQPVIKHLKTVTLEHDISCMCLVNISNDISPEGSIDEMHTDDDQEKEQQSTCFAAVGLWSSGIVNIYKFDGMMLMQSIDLSLSLGISAEEKASDESKIQLNDSILPRSLLFASFPASYSKSNHYYILIGMADGVLLSYELQFSRQNKKETEIAAVTNQKKFVFGASEISLAWINNQHDQTQSKSSSLLPPKRKQRGSNLGQRSENQNGSNKNGIIFVGSDRPAIIYSDGSKLIFSNINHSGITHATSFNTKSFPNSIAISSPNDLSIGSIDEIQRLHVRTIPLMEQPRKICYHEESKNYVLLTESYGMTDDSKAMSLEPKQKISSSAATSIPSVAEFMSMNFIRLIDSQTYSVIDSYQFEDYEMGISLLSTSSIKVFDQDEKKSSKGTKNDEIEIDDQDTLLDKSKGHENQEKSKATEYIIVGTVFESENENEKSLFPKKGRVLIFKVAKDDYYSNINSKVSSSYQPSSPKLVLVGEEVVQGGVFQILSFCEHILVSCNNKLQMYGLNMASNLVNVDDYVSSSSSNSKKRNYQETFEKNETYNLFPVGSGFNGHSMIVSIQAHEDIIVVGDMLKSVCLLKYNNNDKSLEEIASDEAANWVTTVTLLNSIPKVDMIMATEQKNIFFLKNRRLDPKSGVRNNENQGLLKNFKEFYLGEFINCVKKGSISLPQQKLTTSQTSEDDNIFQSSIMSSSSASTTSASSSMIFANTNANSDYQRKKLIFQPSDVTIDPQVLLGSASGAVLIVAMLNETGFKVLRRMQRGILALLNPVGGLTYTNYRIRKRERSYMTGIHTQMQHEDAIVEFIDGDIIESFLQLTPNDQQKVIDFINQKAPDTENSNIIPPDSLPRVTTDTITQLVEYLSRSTL